MCGTHAAQAGEGSLQGATAEPGSLFGSTTGEGEAQRRDMAPRARVSFDLRS